jgi:DNA-binding FadR family transcriptional regulator
MNLILLDEMASSPPKNPLKKRIVESVADELRRRILAGDFAPGERLPGERELATEFGTSRLTLRAALTRLESEGLVRPLHGAGTEVLDFREHGSIDLLGYLAARSLDGEPLSLDLLRDLLELRRIVAVGLLERVSERADEAELKALRRHVIAQRPLVDDPVAFVHADLQFARMMVRASHNFAIELLFNTVARLIESHPGLVLAFQANASRTLDVYDRILALIERRNPDRVARVSRKLLEALDRATLARVAEITGATMAQHKTIPPKSGAETKGGTR